jgi:hypothetical protein
MLGLRDGNPAHPVALGIGAHVDQFHCAVRAQQRVRFGGRNGARVGQGGVAAARPLEDVGNTAHGTFPTSAVNIAFIIVPDRPWKFFAPCRCIFPKCQNFAP